MIADSMATGTLVDFHPEMATGPTHGGKSMIGAIAEVDGDGVYLPDNGR